MRRVDPSVVGLGILVGLYLAATVSLLPLGADDIPMVGVFSFDEANIAGEVLRLHEHSLSTKPSFKYGGAFYYPPVMSLAVMRWFSDVSQQTLVVMIRAFCTLAGAGCLVLTFLLGRAVFGASTGLMAAFFLAATPAFLRWSVEAYDPARDREQRKLKSGENIGDWMERVEVLLAAPVNSLKNWPRSAAKRK